MLLQFVFEKLLSAPQTQPGSAKEPVRIIIGIILPYYRSDSNITLDSNSRHRSK